MLQQKKTKYILELDAKEYATFIAALYVLDREKLEKYYGNTFDKEIYDILIVGKANILQSLDNIYKENFVVSSNIIENVFKGEELK